MSEALRVRASRIAGFLLATLALALPTRGEVARIEVTRRDDFGSHERVIGRVYFGIDPMNAANRVPAVLSLALLPGKRFMLRTRGRVAEVQPDRGLRQQVPQQRGLARLPRAENQMDEWRGKILAPKRFRPATEHIVLFQYAFLFESPLSISRGTDGLALFASVARTRPRPGQIGPDILITHLLLCARPGRSSGAGLPKRRRERPPGRLRAARVRRNHQP